MAKSLSEAMRVINTKDRGLPVPFAIEYISFDSNKSRSGGTSALRKVENAIKIRSAHDDKKNATVTFKKLNGQGVDTVHIKLILKLNGEEVW